MIPVDALRPWINRSLLGYAAIAVLLAVAGWRLVGDGDPGGQLVDAPSVVDAGSSPRARLVVHVAGAVRRPGIYRLAPGARVHDALRRAGGPAPGARADRLNLAAPLQDGQQVLIPAEDDDAGADDGPLSLSRATARDLEDLDGIGPALAARIVEHRRDRGGFASVDQLADVPGIGPTRLEALRQRVVP